MPTSESGLLVLGGDDVGSLLSGPQLLEALARALQAYSAGEADSPPRIAALAPKGLLAAMPAYLPGQGLAAKLIAVFPGNPTQGRPSHQGLVALFDDRDGRPLCVLDAKQITAVRTAAVSALSVRELARPGAAVLAVLGSGEQARSHLKLLATVGEFSELRLASRNPETAAALAAELPGCRLLGSFEEAVRGADVVACCTGSPDPVVDWSWLKAGAHLVSVGMGAELDPAIVQNGRLFVEWRGAVSNQPPAGAVELQGLDPEMATELGEVLAGTRPGRLDPGEVTVFKSTGLGVEDAATALVVYEAARQKGRGTLVAW
jgi:ornithine cyclodeaminase/alanine dehydrogenase-like protein (mu-crystallin family)